MTAEQQFWSDLNLSGMVVYNVGAFHGLLTLFFASRAKAVVCFEPNTQNYQRLMENLTLNGIKNVEVRKAGVGSRRETRRMVGTPLMPGGASVDGKTVEELLRRSQITNAALFEAVNQITIRFNEPNEDKVEVPKWKALGKSMTITVAADESGEVTSITVGLAKLFDGPLDGGRVRQLERRLKDVFTIDPAVDHVVLRVGKSLNFGDLQKVIAVCKNQKIADGNPAGKISLVELGE